MRKKRNCFILLLMFLMFLMSGCTQKGECDGCGQYEELHEYTTKSGSTRQYCDYCFEMAKFVGE